MTVNNTTVISNLTVIFRLLVHKCRHSKDPHQWISNVHVAMETAGSVSCIPNFMLGGVWYSCTTTCRPEVCIPTTSQHQNVVDMHQLAMADEFDEMYARYATCWHDIITNVHVPMNQPLLSWPICLAVTTATSPPPITHTHHPHTLQHIVDPHMVSASLDIAVNNPLSQADNVSRQLARRTSNSCFDVLIPRIFSTMGFY